MIAIDWSHTKDLTTYDGKKVRVETLRSLISRLSKDGKGEESKDAIDSTGRVHSPLVILEQGCPMSLIYGLVSHGVEVRLIDNHATEAHRKEHGIDKSDENDAKIIYELSNNGAMTSLTIPDFKALQLADLYHQYCRYQKARVAMENMKKAHKRQYGLSGDSESICCVTSIEWLQLSPDFLAYDIAIKTLKGKEKELLKKLTETAGKLPLIELGGESNQIAQSTRFSQPPKIKGLGTRIWLGLMITCNPSTFKCLPAYLRFCGLTNDVIQSHRYNRHARMLYHILSEEVMKQRDQTFRPIYDKCKVDIASTHPSYTKLHVHNAALNRTATFLAKAIFNHTKRCGQDDEATNSIYSKDWLQPSCSHPS